MSFWTDTFGNETVGSYIAGEVVPGLGSEIELVNPATEQVSVSYRDGGDQAVDDAVQAAKAAGRAWRGLSASDRGRILWAIGEAVRANIDGLARMEAEVVGKPIKDAIAETTKVAEMFEYYAGWADKQHGEVIPVPSSHLTYTVREPYGVVAQMTPWNAPVFTAGWQLAPALAAGNTVVLKPSELTPLTSIVLARIAEGAGLPVGAVNVIAGLGPTAGQRLVSHPGVAKVVFVGSPATGRVIASAAGQHLKPCVLELGGKSANVVFDDADLARSVGGAGGAIFSGAGQSCVAGSRLLIQSGVFEEVVERLGELAASLTHGDPLAPGTQVGPIQNRGQLEAISAKVGNALRGGAQAITGGARADRSGFYYPPTLLSGVSNADPIAREEVFGPVVVAIPFDDEAEAIELANDTNFGLAGAVWTGSVDRAHRVAAQVKAGTVWVNSYKTINVMAPFGGFGDSGFGRSSGRDGLTEYTQPKAIWVQTDRDAALPFGY